MPAELGNPMQEEALLLEQIRENKVQSCEIPEEYRMNPKVIALQREKGLRRTGQRGYDIILGCFFAEDIICETDGTKEQSMFRAFSAFDEYYRFLEGDIYESACYYQYAFSDEEIERYKVDIRRVNTDCLTRRRIQQYTLAPTAEELEQYKQAEQTKKNMKGWIKKVSACNTYEEFASICKRLCKSSVQNLRGEIISDFIADNKEKAFGFVMEGIAKDDLWLDYHIVYALCCMYDPEQVMEAFCSGCKGIPSFGNNKGKIKQFISRLKAGEVRFEVVHCFDQETHLYCERVRGYLDSAVPCMEIIRYFETFDAFVEYLHGDLSGCDFSKLLFSDIDFSMYKTDCTTLLPVKEGEELDYRIEKGFDRHSWNFYVNQHWRDRNGNEVKSYKNCFSFFFDFQGFLGGDLSGADLLSCDGFEHIADVSNLNLTDVKLRSWVLKQYSLPFDRCEEFLCNVLSNQCRPEMEETIAPMRESNPLDQEEIKVSQRVRYISDLHIMHRIQNAGCCSYEDILYVIRKVVDNLTGQLARLREPDDGSDLSKWIWKEKNGWLKKKEALLIGGDVTSSFQVFQLFVSVLRQTLPPAYPVIFVLGNHELWDFLGRPFEQIVSVYRKVLQKNGMYLLQNELLLKNDDEEHTIQSISNEELEALPKSKLREKVRNARLILYGGLGFAGYNDCFNANNGIYRDTIDRNEEIRQTKIFEQGYHVVCDALSDRPVVIFTHMPLKDWCAKGKRQKGFVYVSGHTHQNMFYDDGEDRLYADNQMGYLQETAYAKFFYVDDEYDTFADYDSGIYQISAEQYTEFYRGKNISMTCNRHDGTIYMLKRKQHYCFLYQTPKGRLQMMLGGAVKHLEVQNVAYYFDRMEDVIRCIKPPLDRYTALQKQISAKVQAIGGSGHIHGCIIDIDFFNHIYLNPFDQTVAGYWALNMIDKEVYPSISMLLEEKCPELYGKYVKLLGQEGNAPFGKEISTEEGTTGQPELYLDTDIYRYSREIKKMQRLDSNILCLWCEPENTMIEE